MKKRILSFLLALLMVVSIFPAPAYATDSTDVTITPTETPTEEATEIATETACPTCGTVGCTSEHLNWCSDCQKDNCGQNHCDTCGAIDCTTEHKICDKCGTLDCTADHTNWCADCKVDNCGQNHCPTCRAIDCTKEHKACETCSVIDCTADHTNWCNICKVDNCGKTHVYCETCQKYDCGENHNATEPTEPATESVAPIDEGDEEETHPMMGKIVTLVESPGLLQAIENPTVSTVGSIVGVNAYPKYMEIEAVVTVGSATYYQLKAADTADNDWPDYYGTSYEHYWLPSTQVTETELPKPCPVCNEYGCTTEHKQCEICGEYDCKAVHFWCDLCEEYDCGKSHLICPACGEVDCTETHTWCPYCAGYDCGIQHEDEYKPDTTPAIPSNPELIPDEAVTVVDEQGNAISTLSLEEGRKTSISAWPAADTDSYQWQVRYNNSNDLWVNIAGATGKGILVSPAMFLNIIDYQGSTAIRCVATSGDEVQISDAIPVIVEEAVPPQEMMMFAARPGTTGSGDAVVTAEGDGAAQYSIIIEFKFSNGDTAAQAWTASLSAGQDYVLDVECPAVVGYKPDRERITETITNISGNVSYTVTYQPDYVDYKVVHYQQDISGNDYTAVKTETKTGLTGSPVGTGLEKEYDGFYDLIYDSGITVAADGSTVINIYYDRYYYLVSLDMNGGFGVEPIYARYGTYITAAALVPQRTGYSFAGWSPALPSEVPIGGSSHTAQWTNANTGFTVAFWYENANDTDYTFVGSMQQTAVTGTKINGESYKDEQYSDYNADYAKHFTYSHADPDVEIKADGSTVVNVYFTRNSYTLTYYKYRCSHTHTSACCSLTPHSHGSGCQYCSLPEHQHSRNCLSNFRNNPDAVVKNELNNKYSNPENGFYCNHKTIVGTSRYYVYLGGSWYRIDDSTPSYNCGYAQHSHSTSCCTLTPHTHGSGCNSYNCSHGSGINCKCDNSIKWYVFYQGTFKYEQDVSAVHAAQGAERWCPGACEGLKKDDGTYYPSYGQSPAHGVYSSMGGGDVDFYQGSAGANEYKLTFWLETYDGSGSWNHNGKNFAQGTTFMAKMGAVGYWGDYDAGCPAGFDTYEAWTSDSIGGSNGTRLNVDQTFSGSTYLYYNFYYIRKNFELTYFNGSTVVANRTMKYDEPLTSSYDLQNLTMTSPYGSGYYFAGWYLDADCTVPVSWGSTRMPDGGLAVYAKWAPLTHTVTTYQTKGGTKLGEYTVTHGETVDNAPSDPVRDGYNFVTWLYEEDATVKAYNFSMPVYKDMALYAEWTSDSLASGTVSYMIEGTNTKIAEDTPISGIVGASKTYSAKTGAELNSGYQTGYFPAVSSHNIEFSTSESQNNWVFYYTKMDEVAYTVRYLEKDTNKVLHAETTGKSNAGKITVTHVTITGYAADAYSKDLVLSSDPALNVVTFYYTKDDVHAPVQVEHYIQNTTGTGYTHYFTEQPYNGNIGETQTAVPLTLTGFTYNKSGNSINGVKLTASGLVLKLYYDRNSYDYAFRFLEKGTNRPLAEAVNGSGLYGAQVSKVAEPIPGYKLVSSGSLTVTIGTDSEANIRTFYYEEDSVTIRYQVGSVKGGTVTPASETVLAVSGDPNGATATAAEDYVFRGWYTTYACNGTAVSTDANFEPSKNSDGVYEAKTYYAKFEKIQYTISFDTNGGTPATIDPISYVYGDTLTLPEVTNENYVVTWTVKENAGDWTMDSEVKNGTINHYGDVTLVANWTIDAIWIDWDFNILNSNKDDILYSQSNVPCGTDPVYAGVATDALAARRNTAQYTYTFKEWMGEDLSQYETLLGDEIKGIIVYRADYERTVNKYTVTWLNEDGTTIDTTEVEYGTIPTHTAPTKEETAEFTYTFAGWTPEVVAVTGDTTYKATYTEVKNQYTLSGEIDHGTVTDPVTVDYGAEATITFTPAAGYKFYSWKVNDGSATSITTSEETWSYEDQQLTENKRVVVTTAPIEYTIAYELDGGSLPEGVTNPGTYTIETLTFTLNNPTRAGYKFKGWATSESETTGKETVTIEKGTTGDKTFYAIWERSLVDLTITTTSADQEQSYIFTVSGTPSDSSYGTITLDVVLVGTDSITIKDLPVGEYTVTEKDDWSWRENAVESKTADLRTASQTVSFDFGVVDDLHWLSGYSYKRKKGGS